MGATWGQQDPGGPHVGPMNFAIKVTKKLLVKYSQPQNFMASCQTYWRIWNFQMGILVLDILSISCDTAIKWVQWHHVHIF